MWKTDIALLKDRSSYELVKKSYKIFLICLELLLSSIAFFKVNAVNFFFNIAYSTVLNENWLLLSKCFSSKRILGTFISLFLSFSMGSIKSSDVLLVVKFHLAFNKLI